VLVAQVGKQGVALIQDVLLALHLACRMKGERRGVVVREGEDAEKGR
jgi:hypothetical protein